MEFHNKKERREYLKKVIQDARKILDELIRELNNKDEDFIWREVADADVHLSKAEKECLK